MKRFALLFVVVLALLLAVPGVVGFQVEKRYQQWQEELQRGGAQIKQHEYQRGWFGASARTVLQLQIPTEPGKKLDTLQLALLSDITHGPLTRGEGFALAEISSQIEVDGKPLFPQQMPEQLQTRVALDGSGSTRVRLPQLEMAAESERPEIRFGGLNGDIRFSSGMSEIEADFDLPELEFVTAKGQRMQFRGLALTSRSHLDASGLMLGSGSFDLAGFSVVDPEQGNRFELQKLRISGNSDSQQGLVSGEVSYRLDRLEINGSRFGPGLMTLGLEQLSADALEKLQQGMEQVRQMGLSEQQQGQQLLGVLLGQMDALLRTDPKFSLAPFTLTTPQGEVAGRFSIQSVGLRQAEISNPQGVLQKLRGVFELSMPEVYYRMLFRQQAMKSLQQQLAWRRLQDENAQQPTQQQLDEMADKLGTRQLQQLLRQEILKRNGTLLYTKASLADGLLTVNGKLLPIPIFQPAG